MHYIISVIPTNNYINITYEQLHSFQTGSLMSYVLQTSKQSSIVRSTHWCDQCKHCYQNYQSDHNVKPVTRPASHCLFIMEQTQDAYCPLLKKHKNTICENTSFP